VGAAVGDALGMPLEFGPRSHPGAFVREMTAGRLPAGTFTDDTELALALAESLLANRPLDPADLANRFVAWYRASPADVGLQIAAVLSDIISGSTWEDATRGAYRNRPDSAGNGSVMRCWPVALADWDDLSHLVADSRVQSMVTHWHPECVAASAFVNVVIYHLLRGVSAVEAVDQAAHIVEMPEPLAVTVKAAPNRHRQELMNTGWVCHTLESAIWGLLTTDSFEEAVVQVVNLGNDTDTAGAVVGALAGAAYGLSAIPLRWREAVQGEWPVGSGTRCNVVELTRLADRLLSWVQGWA
jgi:ADP-ribosyl-[dinitrogen reductase] hydrolase